MTKRCGFILERALVGDNYVVLLWFGIGLCWGTLLFNRRCVKAMSFEGMSATRERLIAIF